MISITHARALGHRKGNSFGGPRKGEGKGDKEELTQMFAELGADDDGSVCMGLVGGGGVSQKGMVHGLK